MAVANRPLGVTIICILGWIGSLLSILGGLALLGIGALLGEVMGGGVGTLLATLGPLIGVLVLVLGIVNFIVLYWLWQMKKQGWTWTMVLEVISLILSLAQMNIIGMIIPGIVVVYLWMKKDLFK